jgi:glycosyltransferase involved in cell wall biosynthesis
VARFVLRTERTIGVRVAIVHDWLTGTRGGEKCLECFCELFPDADLYTLIYLPSRVSPTIRAMKISASWLNRLPKIEKYYRYALPLLPRVIEEFSVDNYDLILSSSHCVAKGILPHGALHIAYIHSPMRYVWDQHDAYFGPDASWPARVGMAVYRRCLQQWDVHSSERVDYFIANSHNVAAKIKNLYSRDAAVIYPPVEWERFHIIEDHKSYFLIVSALVPYKKIDIAIQAFNVLALPLKIVGDGPLRKRLQKLARPNIEFLGWVSDQALPGLYASCQALIFPGEEDFGIVALEAQASGRPVIAYGRGGALESVVPLGSCNKDTDSGAAPTGIFFEEANARSLIAALRLFSAKKDWFNPAAIRRNACRFSRDRFKMQITNFINASVQGRVRSPNDA